MSEAAASTIYRLLTHKPPHLADDDVNLLRQLHGLNHSLDDRDLVSQLQAEEELPQLNSPMSYPALACLGSSMSPGLKQLCSQLLAHNTSLRAIRKAVGMCSPMQGNQESVWLEHLAQALFDFASSKAVSSRTTWQRRCWLKPLTPFALTSAAACLAMDVASTA